MSAFPRQVAKQQHQLPQQTFLVPGHQAVELSSWWFWVLWATAALTACGCHQVPTVGDWGLSGKALLGPEMGGVSAVSRKVSGAAPARILEMGQPLGVGPGQTFRGASPDTAPQAALATALPGARPANPAQPKHHPAGYAPHPAAFASASQGAARAGPIPSGRSALAFHKPALRQPGLRKPLAPVPSGCPGGCGVEPGMAGAHGSFRPAPGLSPWHHPAASLGPRGLGPAGYPGFSRSPGSRPYADPFEYICDGGDNPPSAVPGGDRPVAGLQPEDTVARFETFDGRVEVEAANKVCLYSPRFAAVRVVSNIYENQLIKSPSQAEQALVFGDLQENRLPLAGTQPLMPIQQIGRRKTSGIHSRQFAGLTSQRLLIFDVAKDVQVYDDFAFIKFGVIDGSQKPMLAQRAQSALSWTSDQGIQVVLGTVQAKEVVFDQKPEEVYEVHVAGKSRLRLLKIASTDNAKPGEIVSFTLRFDNVGDRPIDGVVIVDNLTPRLEYVPDSAQASVKSGYQRDEQGEIVRTEDGHPVYRQNPVSFSTESNEAESLTLTWELQEPLEPEQGGVIRFQCRVR